jgi:hypothetical protein
MACREGDTREALGLALCCSAPAAGNVDKGDYVEEWYSLVPFLNLVVSGSATPLSQHPHHPCGNET